MHNVKIIVTYKNVVANLKRKECHAFAELLEWGSENEFLFKIWAI